MTIQTFPGARTRPARCGYNINPSHGQGRKSEGRSLGVVRGGRLQEQEAGERITFTDGFPADCLLLLPPVLAMRLRSGSEEPNVYRSTYEIQGLRDRDVSGDGGRLSLRGRIAGGAVRGGHHPPVQRGITTLPFESCRAPVGGAHL